MQRISIKNKVKHIRNSFCSNASLAVYMPSNFATIFLWKIYFKSLENIEFQNAMIVP